MIDGKSSLAGSNNTPSHDASTKQRTASDPTVSSWVSASAGSGKTKVLTDRMLRLLLPRESGERGTHPEKILALTFTKAGANEMSLRLSKRLSEWAVMDDEKLSHDMDKNLFGRTPTREELLAARKLFARMVDTPGGLKIMTIHSFCQSVLGRFPIESGLPPNFKPLEEEDARALMVQARRHVLARARSNPASPLALAVEHIGQVMNEEQLSALLSNMNSERNQLKDVLTATFGIDGLYTQICMLLEIKPGQSEYEALVDFCRDTSTEPDIRHACSVLTSSKSETDKAKAVDLQAYWDASVTDRAFHYQAYRKIFISTKNELKKTATKAVTDQHPDVLGSLTREGERLLAFDSMRKAILCASLTRDSFVLGHEILEEYQKLKERTGGLDFDDLILKTLSLLKGETMAGLKDVSPWVMYKLDEGLDHILVDEAQDTNPEQWAIIQSLSEEFFTGLGAKDIARTIFVVGDEKQSIFSFQRAAPDKFGDMFKFFNKTILESGAVFSPVDINTSFRSVQTVLDAVDSVFASQETVRSLTSHYLNHIAHRNGQAGLVELWPLFKNKSGNDDEAKESQDWLIPVTLIESQSGASQMAAKIGDTIKNWLDQSTQLESYNRPINAGDIMVLVKSRNAFVGQLVRALKTRGIAVSGVDRMILSEQLVVQDLCAGASFALLPEDDLILAGLLKSPFIGYTEQALYDLAQTRSGNLWNALKSNGDSIVVSWLETLIETAGNNHPYEFFSRMAQEPCPADSTSGLRAIKKRLGEDALDPLNEFLNLALEYETGHTAGLQSFLKWHEEGKSEIKRQLEEGGGAVRIMTVHGSKGLQAPIVFLPDTVRTGAGAKTDRMLWPQKSGLTVPLIASSKENAPDIALNAISRIQAKQDEEYRRLLYVAMTRAEERLYIGGFTGKKLPSATSETPYWHNDVRKAFEENDAVEKIPSGIMDDDGHDMPILRLSTKRTAVPDKEGKSFAGKDHGRITLPVYFYKNAPEEPFPPQPLVPSRPSDPEPAAASPVSNTNLSRFKRGTVTHKLLQTLPEIKPEQRRVAAEKFVARAGFGLEPSLQKSIVEETLAVLADPVFAPVFGVGSMAEIPVTGFLDGKTLISGQIDRLVITNDEVLIVDFKTNRPPPQNVEDIQPVYRRQMEAYARAIRQIYPDKTVRCALLWTDGPRLMEVTAPV